jgi:hypothetical protein
MSTDEAPFSVCDGCGQRIDPDDPSTVKVPTRQRVDTTDGPSFIDGFPKLYHPGCRSR